MAPTPLDWVTPLTVRQATGAAHGTGLLRNVHDDGWGLRDPVRPTTDWALADPVNASVTTDVIPSV